MLKVEYTVSDKDVTDSYFYMLKNSFSFKKKIAVMTFIIMMIPISMSYFPAGSITTKTYLLSIFIGFAYPFGMPYLARFLAKKGNKSINIKADGLQILVGAKDKLIPWAHIENTLQTPEYLFILGKSGNYFCIPKSAFKDSNNLDGFVSNISEYIHA